MWVDGMPDPVQYHTVVDLSRDTGQADAPVVVRLREVSRFGHRDDIGEATCQAACCLAGQGCRTQG